ncbi:MAG TPA: hypothetical protein VKT25_06360 [Ktedonobacteraceae bacterium]|nr:hypothetical protein [Ktedonobacteraceae bacterium]
MAQSKIQSAESIPARVEARPADRAERSLRRAAAWIMLIFLLQGELGAIWDREWHFFVGRDWFWTPPHTLIYSSVAGAGIVALVVVLADTVRYYRGAPGVNDTSTISVFKFFHAPLGFVIAGFGTVVALTAAPLDNYWHNLYGIDIAMWAPFHMMGITGGVIGILGMIYVFSSEAAIQRDQRDQREAGSRHAGFLGLSLLEWGALLIAAGMINFTFIGFLQFPIATFGLLRIPSYPLPLAVCGSFALIGVMRLTQRPGTATLVVLLAILHTVAEGLFVPWAIRTAVALQGLSYRVPQAPYFNVTDALLPLMFLASALIVDGVAFWRQRHGQSLNVSLLGVLLLGIAVTLPQLVTVPWVLSGSLNIPLYFLVWSGITIPPDLRWQAALIAIPVILACGVIGAFMGATFGDIWRWNKS